jgi:hypothetical protein
MSDYDLDHDMARRDFLKAAPAAVSLLALAVQPLAPAPLGSAAPATVGGQPFTPVADYPIRATRFSEVTMTDAFWKPKITTNADVTIPKRSDSARLETVCAGMFWKPPSTRSRRTRIPRCRTGSTRPWSRSGGPWMDVNA